MKQHLFARKDENSFGSNDGGDSLVIKKDEFQDFMSIIYFEVSDIYKKKFDNLSSKEMMRLIVYLLKNMDEDYCQIEIGSDSLIFKMNSEGYRYQFNGYKRPDIKLLEKANLFILLTLVTMSLISY